MSDDIFSTGDWSQPPKDMSKPLQALWWAAKDDWDAAHEIVMKHDDADCAWVAGYFTDLVKRSRGLQLTPGTGDRAHGAILLRLSGQMPAEGYRLDITPDGVTVTAQTRAGLFCSFSPMAMPSATENPWPSEPVLVSTHGRSPMCGWP